MSPNVVRWDRPPEIGESLGEGAIDEHGQFTAVQGRAPGRPRRAVRGSPGSSPPGGRSGDQPPAPRATTPTLPGSGSQGDSRRRVGRVMAGTMGTGGDGQGRRALDTDINMVPMIDLLMVTIAFLLLTAVWSQMSRIEGSARVPGPDVGTVPLRGAERLAPRRPCGRRIGSSCRGGRGAGGGCSVGSSARVSGVGEGHQRASGEAGTHTSPGVMLRGRRWSFTPATTRLSRTWSPSWTPSRRRGNRCSRRVAGSSP